MNANLPFNAIELWHIAGWTMVHFLWLGTLIAAAALLCRLLLRRVTPNARYVAALLCLMLLAATPVGIAGWLIQSSPSLQGDAGGAFVGPAVQVAGVEEIEPPIIELSNLPSIEREPGAEDRVAAVVPRSIEPTPGPSRPGSGIWLAALESFVPYLPWLWLIGTPITFMLLAAGIVGTKRLKRASSLLDNGPITELLARLAGSLRIGRRVGIAVCDRIASPVLIGIVRPIILLPPAALTGWSPEEIEMVLLHELAHVRRWDNLVNLLQRCIESLLFFHPAVWLVSNWVRREREACCDAAVVARTQRPHAYAELLVALAAQMPRSVLFHPVATSAMAASPLRSRIRRILELEDDPMLISGKSFTLMLGAFLTAATLAVLYVPAIGQAEESTTEITEDTENSPATNEGEESKAHRLLPIPQTKNNLKDLAIAILNYENVYRALPPHAIYDASGKPLLSWRVRILPFLDQDKLYEEFHLDEPWDSEHNRKLLARMPDVFKNPKLDEADKTNYFAVVGKECGFDGSPKGIKLSQVRDGTARTIALVEADADQAVEWTKPEDWQFDRKSPTSHLGGLWTDRWHAAWMDGGVREIFNIEPPDLIGIQFTRAGGETRSLTQSEGVPPPSGEGTTFDAGGKFPSLEEQKLADLAYERLRLELEPIGEDELKRVQALGYEGGLRITSAPSGMGTGGILVGLHVWPTASLAEVAKVLSRDDLADLTPLKYYIVDQNLRTGEDVVRTGRISVNRESQSRAERGGQSAVPSKQAPRSDPYSASPTRQPVPMPTQPYQAPQRTPTVTPLAPDAIEDQVNAVLDQDPQWATLHHQLATVQMQLAELGSSQRPRAAGLQLQIERHQRLIAEYRQRVKEHVKKKMTNGEQSLAKSALRYDGKAFDQWRDACQTELSTEKRLEAVKALAAFGAHGYGREAAEAILEVAGQYDWTTIGGNKAIAPLQNACIEAFSGEPRSQKSVVAHSIQATEALPALSAAAKSGNRQQKQFLTYVLPWIPGPDSVALRLALSKDEDATVRKYALRILPNLGSDDYSEEISARVREALNSSNPGEVVAAMHVIWPSRDKSATRKPYPYLAQLAKWIFSPHEDVRKQARNLASGLQSDDATHIAEVALAVLEDGSKKGQHIEAIRALAALGPAAKPAVDTLRPLIKSGDQPLAIAAAAALKRILKQSEYTKLLYDELSKRYSLGFSGEFLQLPAGEKQEEFNAFQRAVQDEEKRLFF